MRKDRRTSTEKGQVVAFKYFNCVYYRRTTGLGLSSTIRVTAADLVAVADWIT